MFAIVRERIDLERISEATRNASCGAVTAFAGIVRAQADDGRPVIGLSYEAYDLMAIRTFEEIADEARATFGPCEISIVHRVGDLDVGEIAVAVVVASAHRAAAFDACEYAIDAVKARAPIWKRERYADGEEFWKDNACGQGTPAP
ncbi:MAG TPA: molybdenum cofactor biosynthesis protein MoaE [Candidatus Baltobacteraceae bacterium]